MPTYDLTHPLEPGMPTYPGDPPVALDAHATVEDDGYRVTDVRLGSHAGTHVDAPSHTEPEGASLGVFDPERFVFDARVVDCRPCDPREGIGPASVPDFDSDEGANDPNDADGSDGPNAPDGPAASVGSDTPGDPDLLVFRTGWDAHWGEPRYWDHPYLTPAAAERCADLGVAVALDAASPDPTPAGHGAVDASAVDDVDEPTGVPAHRALLGAGLPVLENLTGLDPLPSRFELRAYPLRMDTDGSPVRAVGVVDG